MGDAAEPVTGIVTEPIVVDALIEACKDEDPVRIRVAESTAVGLGENEL